jgi:mono/diheme cytochrome c family protein
MVLRKMFFVSLAVAYGSAALVILSSCTEGGEEIGIDSGESANVEVDGKLLFTNQCVSCHGPKGDLGNSGAKDLTKSKLDEAAVLKIIKEGKGTMPPFEYLLTTEKEREAVVQHVMSFRKEEK